jgi:hypothetical protein
MALALVLLNAVVALISAGFAVIGLARPAALLPAALLSPGTTITPAVTVYAWCYAVWAIPLTAIMLAVLIGDVRTAAVPVLLIGGLAQVGDFIIGVRYRHPGMTTGSAVAAFVHLGSIWWLVH